MKTFYPKLSVFLVIMLVFVSSSFAQNKNRFWTKTTQSNISKSQLNFRKTEPIKSEFFQLDITSLKQYLSDVSKRGDNNKRTSKLVSFPTADGSFETFDVIEASIMELELQQKYTSIKTYVGQSIDNPTNTIRFSITPQGLHTISSNEKSGMQYIDPYTKGGDTYIVYAKKDLPTINQNWVCGVEDQGIEVDTQNNASKVFNANDGMLRNFRLALACTIEYASFHWMAAGIGAGEPEAVKRAAVLAAMVVTINRNNFIYERDLSMTMTLVANNESIIFINSDSFDNNNAGTLINQSQTVIDATIGSPNYDIGHTFSTGGGGLAQLNSPCVNGNKARGITGLPNPVGDPYDVDFVAHELGHQYGAPHTFNGSTGNCAGNNRSASNAYEPGSGTTIMAYAGICAPQNVQNNSDAYFHQKSIQMIWDNISMGNSQCANQTATGNSAPTSNAGADYVIPKSTPYKLTGTSTDADGIASHTYTWEQYDLGPAGLPQETNTTGPLVRSFEGTSNPTRYIPRLNDVLNNGGVSTEWEKLASVGRTMDFRLTVRDNGAGGGQTAVDEMTATVDGTDGPFLVTSQNTDQIVWTPGTTETITWNVAGTATGAGVATPNVNILLSTDQGLTFDTVLASNVPNDGSHDITVPAISAPFCRIMVEGAGNIFYNLNDFFFAVGDYNYVEGDICEDYVFNQNITVVENAGSYTGYALNVPDNLTISDLNISVDFTTPNNGDLWYAIRAPWQTGEIQQLASGICSGSVDTNFIFDDQGNAVNCASTNNGDNVLPQVALSFANGQPSNGTWVFFLTDINVDGVTSTWNSATITICEAGGFIPVLSNDSFDLEVDNFVVYPNPNNGEFTVQLDNASGDIALGVYDIRGRRIFQENYKTSGGFNQSIDLGQVQSGIYLLNLKNNGKTITKKIVVE